MRRSFSDYLKRYELREPQRVEYVKCIDRERPYEDFTDQDCDRAFQYRDEDRAARYYGFSDLGVHEFIE